MITLFIIALILEIEMIFMVTTVGNVYLVIGYTTLFTILACVVVGIYKSIYQNI